MKIFHLHTTNPNKREIQMIATSLDKGSIAIIPTDTVYALACKLTNKSGIERICKITGKKEKEAKMTVICSDLKQVSDYAQSYSNDVFKTIKRYSPGPFVYILNANKYVQKYFKNKKSEIGVRIPNSEIIQSLLEQIDGPIISTSLNKEDVTGFYTDPEEIEKIFESTVDILINAGAGDTGVSTILDCTGDTIEIIREGKGLLD